MIRDKSKFIFLSPIYGGQVIFKDYSKGKVIDKSKVDKALNIYIDNVLYVKGLKHNFLGINQFYDKGNKHLIPIIA